MNPKSDIGADGSGKLRPFIVRALIVLGLFALALGAWRVREAYLLAFASILVAVLLTASAAPVRRWTGLSRTWSLVAAGGAIVATLALFGWLVGARLQSQVAELAGTLPNAIESIEQRVGIEIPIGDSRDETGARQNRSGETQSGGFSAFDDLLRQLFSLGATALAAAAGLVLVVIGGCFLAVDPDVYRRGLIKLLPPSQHPRADATLTDCGRVLHLWLIAELIAMALVGLLAGFGTWAIGLQAPLALGLFAGLAEFVPMVGPIIGAIPALLLAFPQGNTTVLWTLALFVAIQQLESNVITPLLQKRMVEVPPALLLFAVVAFGLLFGLLGVVIAAPLTLVAFVAVKKLHVRDALGQPTEIPRE